MSTPAGMRPFLSNSRKPLGGRRFQLEPLTFANFLPARQGVLILVAGVDPAALLAFPQDFLLPERRMALQIIHQEFRGLERRLPMRRRGDDEHDRLAGMDAAVAMHD